MSAHFKLVICKNLRTKMTNKITKAVIPVAGLGTRMLPATKAIPKEMLPIVDKPMIQYIVDECVAAGIKEIVLVTHSSKNAIENSSEPRCFLLIFSPVFHVLVHVYTPSFFF